MMNQLNEIQVCYIDMIESQGIDEDGIPYFIDLYLDLVVEKLSLMTGTSWKRPSTKKKYQMNSMNGQ